MTKDWKSRLLKAGRNATLVVAAVTLAGMLLSLTHVVHFDIKGHWDGVFLLKGQAGWQYELKDDLYVGDGHRLIWGMDLEPEQERIAGLLEPPPQRPYLFYQWDAKEGSGFIRNYLKDGTQLFTSFGRFADDDGGYVHGLFVGGGLPTSIIGNDNVFMDNSGMAFFDGTRWYHVWCNVNEGIVSGTTYRNIPPSRWKFLGSRILDKSARSLAVTSSHLAEVDGAPLKIDRFMYMAAGEPFFILTIRVTNTGGSPVPYFYAYGDEPWVGNYGSSKGNVGWVRDRIIEYETTIDSKKYTFAGIFDYGSSVIGEGHDFTKIANFIEWFGENRPTVFFSNGNADKFDPSGKTPLSSNTRFLGLQWGPRTILPGQSDRFVIAVGMAGHDPATGFPVKPPISLGFAGDKQ